MHKIKKILLWATIFLHNLKTNLMLRSKFIFITLFAVSLLLSNDLSAQSGNWRSHIEQLADNEEISSIVIDNMFEDLLFLENNPIDLNKVSYEQLERFQLLSFDEATSIYQFLELNRPLLTVYELRNVPNLSYNTILLILPFFYVGDESDENSLNSVDITDIPEIIKDGRNDLQLRFDKNLNRRAGYKEYSDSILQRYPNRKYRGEDFYTSLRYSYRYRDKIQMGLTAEKDAGEPFMMSNYPKGYDHYGVHLLVRDIGNIKTIVLGDYRLSFGQGLILNNDFMVNKAWGINNIAKRTLQPKRHFSTAESGFFRGAAAQISIGNLSFTPFYSNRRIDANLSESGDITSLKVDGLHRTPLEISKKNNSREQVMGANLNFRKEHLQIGISGIYNNLDRMYNPAPKNYNIYAFRGLSNINGSLDYSYQLPGFIFAGETAIDKNGTVATLNMAQYRPSTNASFTVLHRHYPITYNAIYAQAFSEGSDVQNENGLFLSSTFTPFSRFSVSTYIDLIRFPWLKYRIDKPSSAIDYYLLATYTISRQSFFEVRYKFRQKEQNTPNPIGGNNVVLPYNVQKMRLRYSNELRSGWGLRTTLDFAGYSEETIPTESGCMISQNVSYRGNSDLTGDLFMGWFNAATFDVRLYSYERNLLNTFYMPSFYGKGMRLALSAKYEITSSVSFSIKAGHTHYLNRDTIGTGTEMIDGDSRTDLYSYLRFIF